MANRNRIDIPFYKDNYVPSNTTHDNEYDDDIFTTPKALHKYLDDSFFGHDTFKRELAVFFWKLHRGIRPTGSLLIVGPTGCGKTEAFRALSKIYRNIQVADASVITPQGYKGEAKLNSFLKRLDFSSELMPVLVIDEFDKLYTESRFSTDMISYELLKMLEGGIVNAGTEEKPHFVDTSKCAFVLLGSFAHLYEKRGKTKPIGFGTIGSNNIDNLPESITEEKIFDLLPAEVQGRIEKTVIMQGLSEENYLSILRSSYSPANKLGQALGKKIYISESKATEIANHAYNSKIGVRSMNNEINSLVNEILYRDPDVMKITIE